jgi:hypothetical protein
MGGFIEDRCKCPTCAFGVKKIWTPECWTENRTPFGDPEVEVIGCPREYITADSIELVQLSNRSRIAKDATGASLYGSDLSKWSSKMVDAFNALEIARRSYEASRMEAERHEAQR